MHSRLIAGTYALIISPAQHIHSLTESLCLRKVNNGIPKTRGPRDAKIIVPDYGIGWTLPTAMIRRECQRLDYSPLPFDTPFEKAIQIYFSPTIPYHQIKKIFTE